jgi:hypothetical protein
MVLLLKRRFASLEQMWWDLHGEAAMDGSPDTLRASRWVEEVWEMDRVDQQVVSSTHCWSLGWLTASLCTVVLLMK